MGQVLGPMLVPSSVGWELRSAQAMMDGGGWVKNPTLTRMLPPLRASPNGTCEGALREVGERVLHHFFQPELLGGAHDMPW